MATKTTILSGPGTVVLRNKYLGQSGFFIGAKPPYLGSAAPDTRQIIKHQIETTARLSVFLDMVVKVFPW